MSSYTLGKAAEKFLSGAIDLTSDAIKVALIDSDDIGAAVSAATNATPIVVTAAGHGLTTGQRALLIDVGGNAAANGVFLVEVSGDALTLKTLAGADVAGSGAYTSGGRVIALDEIEFYDEIEAAEVGISANLASKTVTGGVFDAADPAAISSVTGDPVELLAVIQDTGSSATSPVLALLVPTSPFTPNGSDVAIAFDADGVFAIT